MWAADVHSALRPPFKCHLQRLEGSKCNYVVTCSLPGGKSKAAAQLSSSEIAVSRRKARREIKKEAENPANADPLFVVDAILIAG